MLGPRPRGAPPGGPLGHRLGAVDGFEGQHGHLKCSCSRPKELGHPGARQPRLFRDGGAVGDEAAQHVARQQGYLQRRQDLGDAASKPMIDAETAVTIDV